MTVSLDSQTLAQLVHSAQRGDRPAADRLVREHDRWLRSVIYGVSGRPELVDDVVQQVWTQVFERLDSLRDARALRPWLYNIARHAAIDAGMARARQLRGRAGLEAAAGAALADRRGESPVAVVLEDEARTEMLRAIQSLPAIYREPFVLRHLEDWTYARIGEVLGLSVETVETRLVRARRMLREMLKGKVSS